MEACGNKSESRFCAFRSIFSSFSLRRQKTKKKDRIDAFDVWKRGINALPFHWPTYLLTYGDGMTSTMLPTVELA